MFAAALDAEASYVEAVRAYEDLELDDALAGFRALAEEKDRSPAEQARLLVWVGVTHAQKSELAAAAAAFDGALALDRDVALPARAAPKIEALFAEAVARLPQAPEPPPVEEPLPPKAGAPVGAIVTGAIGAVALAGAIVASAFTAVHYSGAVDPTTAQPEAKALVDLANAELASAIVLGAAGAALACVALVLLDVESAP